MRKDACGYRQSDASIGRVHQCGNMTFDWSGRKQKVSLLSSVANLHQVRNGIQRSLLVRYRGIHIVLLSISMVIDTDSFKYYLG